MKNVLLIIFLAFSNCLFSQSKIDSLENLLPNKQGLDKVELLNELAFSYWNISPDKGLDYAKKAYSIAEKEDSKKDIAASLQTIGINYWAKGELHLALENYQKSLNIYEKINDLSKICSLNSNIGIVYKDLSDYENALKHYLISLNISEKNGFTSLYISIVSNISSIYLIQKNYPKALEYIQEAIDLSEKLGKTNNYSALLNAMGQIYDAQNNYKKAKSIYLKSLLQNKEHKNNYGVTINLYNIGNVEYKLENYTSALKYFQESLNLSQKINDQIGILMAYKSIGLVDKELNKFDSALLYYKRSLNLANELDAKEDILDIYNSYYELYKTIGNYNKSLAYLEKYVSLKDSIYNENSSKQIAEMQTKYDSEKKEKENELLRKNSEIQELAIAKQTNLRNSFIGLSLLVIFMIIILLNRFTIKKKANQLLIQKNEIILKQRDKLKKMNSAKDKFFSIVSHDLRNPFNSILGFTDLLNKEYDSIGDEEKREIIKSLHDSSTSTYKLLENILAWARTQKGEIEINKKQLNLKELIENSIAPYVLNASNKGIKILINVPSDAMILIDQNTAMTIIANLVNNAIKFTPNGGTITINHKEYEDNVELHIIDTGIGMTSQVIGNLFRIDKNVSTLGTNDEKGTGLGLILCKEFINKNGGDISVKSEVGKGSDFIINLPK